MTRGAFIFPAVLTASASALAGGLLSAPSFKSTEIPPLVAEEGPADELRRLPFDLRAAAEPAARPLFLHFPPGTEPGLGAWMREEGFARPLATDGFLYANIASLRRGFGELDDNGAEPQRFSGGLAFNWGRDRFAIPVYHDRSFLSSDEGVRRYDALGLEWSRRLGGDHQLSFSAQFGDSIYLGQPGRDTTSTVAQLAWSSELGGAARPRITGGVFLGSETPKERDLGASGSAAGRKYYGVSLESRFTAFQKHTPFAAVQIARSDYDGADGAVASGTTYYPGVGAGYGYPGSGGSPLPSYRRDEYSRVLAGWNWQIQPNWGLRAEAYYSLNSSGVTAYDYDRSQFFFSTRYDFR